METVPSGSIPTAIGSTEPTAEEMRHWTPEMRALAERDGVTVSPDRCAEGDPDASTINEPRE